MKSLYVHFPFCETKCHYCDFYSLGRERTRDGDANRFETALRRECEPQMPQSGRPLLAESLPKGGDRFVAFLDFSLDTIFFGGGTPSMTPPESMARALEPLQLQKRMTADIEWTMEANPSSIELRSFEAYRAMGINRISMGVQSMKNELLTKLGRVHSRERALQALEVVFSAGFTNVSTDLLCGVPGQTLQDLEEAMTSLFQFPLSHLSCYLLTLPKHHKMYSELPDENTQLEHLLFIDEFMRAKGLEHYEISNFARPGKQARHNLGYWKGESYLGLGPSAHSYDAATHQRWKNVSSLHKYAALLEEGKSPVEWTEALTPEQLDLEKWMLSLRLSEGFPEAWLEAPTQKEKAHRLMEEGLLEAHPARVGFRRLTARGFALSDQVIRLLA